MKEKQEEQKKSKGKVNFRHYKNPFDEYDPNQDAFLRYGKIYPDVQVKLKCALEKWLEHLKHSEIDLGEENYTIYKGSCGVALLYFLLLLRRKNSHFLDKAIEIVEKCLPHLKDKHVGFLQGDAGPLALAAVLYHYKGLEAQASKMVTRLRDMSSRVLAQFRPKVSDELGFGRAGYLHALLFVRKHLGEDSLPEGFLKEVAETVLEAGRRGAERGSRHVPLAWAWQGRCYLGAAHGQAGILAQLLQAAAWLPGKSLEECVAPTLDYLRALCLASGNLPVALGSQGDRLVQWCHGAPGLALTLVLAYTALQDERWLRAAEACADLTWKRGLLTKGYGLCHGVAGNAYVFLALYRATKNPLHLHRACRFAEWCTTYDLYQRREPDQPLSLFEGVAGPAYFMVDLLSDPMKAAFPGFIL